MNQAGLTLGSVPPERADAARNRRHLLATAREMLAEQGAERAFRSAAARPGRPGG